MTADVVPIARKPKVVGVVEDPVGIRIRSLDKRTLAIERCADQIERALRQRLTLEQRIGLERALDDLADEITWHKRDPWC